MIFTFAATAAISAAGYIYFSQSEDLDDTNLFTWISTENEYAYYHDYSTNIPTSEETKRAHDDFMRIRLNRIASSVLDPYGKLCRGISFPDSSIIIKEIYSDKNSLSPDLLAIMVKMKGAKDAGEGWLWA